MHPHPEELIERDDHIEFAVDLAELLQQFGLQNFGERFGVNEIDARLVFDAVGGS